MNPNALAFGALLRRHRLAAGLTQETLAEQAELSVHAISDLERGLRTAPHFATIQRLAEALALGAAERTTFGAAARAGIASGSDGSRPQRLLSRCHQRH